MNVVIGVLGRSFIKYRGHLFYMEVQVTEAGKIINPNEKVIVWRIGEYFLIKKIEEKKVLEKIGEIRKKLENKGTLLSDDEVVKIVKEAREEWKKL